MKLEIEVESSSAAGTGAHPQPAWTGLVRVLALLVFPFATAVVVLWLDVARGPFWLSRNLDPAYIHLMNGLSVALLGRRSRSSREGSYGWRIWWRAGNPCLSTF